MAQSGIQSLSPFDVLKTYVPSSATDIPSEVGAVGVTPDGRVFRLGALAASGSTLAPAKLAGGPTPNVYLSANNSTTASTQSIGDTQITLTFTSTSFAANSQAGGLLAVTSGTGIGQTCVIKSHPVVASGTSCVFTLQDPLIVATTGSPYAMVIPNPYSSAVIYPSTAAGDVLGVNLISVVADATYNTYVWFQTQGPCLILNDAGTAADLGIKPSTNTPGAVMTTATTGANIGTAIVAATSTDYSFFNLNIYG